MNEEHIKAMCKFVVEYGNRPFSRKEKETIKQEIGQSNN